MRRKQVGIQVTHQFVEDPAGVRRAYDAWAIHLARALDLGLREVEERLAPITQRPKR